MNIRRFSYCIACFSLVVILTTAVFAQLHPDKFKNMKARCIGPAGMSGRVAAIEVVISNPNIIYVGAATGGVWKSTDSGLRFTPIFDDQPVSSIGALAIFQKNPSIVWVGTGEANPRNSCGVGYGVYKSTDGGLTWEFCGLGKTEKISRIRLDSDNPDIAYVAALGTTWGENPQRGVFKTKDGGKTWQNILYVDEKTGCADLEIDPENPNKLFAAMWEHRRWPWFFKSGGPGSGLYVTQDGGENWKKVTDGLPEGELGRIGIAIARNNNNIVYAQVEAKKSAFCRSDDGGKTWKTLNDKTNISRRPFYYSDIRVDPENENRVYSLQTQLLVSEDGGRNFNYLFSNFNIHPDFHALWIHPEDGNFLISGSDGGVGISRDRGKTWRFVENLPLAQFYHINIDLELPYNVYGGMQDNGVWRGPSDIWGYNNDGILNHHWEYVLWGDGFAALSIPSDPDYVYCMREGGWLYRTNLVTGERMIIRPDPPPGVKLRFNWNAGVAIGAIDHETLYCGSQYLHRSFDRGESWKIISPDLTTNDPKKQKQDESGGLTLDGSPAENHTTILTVAPSPVREGVIWVGTDDGNVQITYDGGLTWKNMTSRIDKNLPDATWCPHIEASRFDAGTAYVVFDDHRRSNWTTYIYKTEDYGNIWKSLTVDCPAKVEENEMMGFVHVIEEDPVDKNLLYVGTEFGLYISFDGGGHWMKWTHGIPAVPIRALIVHPRDHDLVIGTHGRSAYILDDIRPLRGMSKEILEKPLHLFEIPSTYQHEMRNIRGGRYLGDSVFRGESREYGALITYSLNRDRLQERTGTTIVIIEIMNETGEIIRRMRGTNFDGINRIVWTMQRDAIRYPTDSKRGFLPPGQEILPGTYSVRVIAGEYTETGTVEVKLDPKIEIPITARKEKYNAVIKVWEWWEVVKEAIRRINETKKGVEMVLERIKGKDDESFKMMRYEGGELKKKLEDISKKFIGPQNVPGFINKDYTVMRNLGYAAQMLESSYDAPTPAQMGYVRRAEYVLEKAIQEFNRIFDEDVAAFKRNVEALGLSLFPVIEPLEKNWKNKEKH